MSRILGLESEHYSGNWSVVKIQNDFALDSKIRDAGWNLFSMTEEVKAMFFGAITPEKVKNALQRILGKVQQHHFNALEVTGVETKRFLGVTYTMVSAQSRHIQQSCYLQSDEERFALHSDAEWARS